MDGEAVAVTRESYKNKTETGEVPTDSQVRRYIKSMREDLSLLTVTNFAVLLVLIFALVLKL